MATRARAQRQPGKSSQAGPVILWFRQDLRLADNHALGEAVASGRPVLPCYVLDDSAEWSPGAAARWWLHHSLHALANELRRRGGRLILRAGSAPAAISKLAAETGANTVYASEIATPGGRARDRAVAARLERLGAELRTLPGSLLFGTDPVRTGSGSPFQVFTPFSRACLALPEPGLPRAAPKSIRFFTGTIDFEELDDWQLRPMQPNWAAGFERRWQPGEAGAMRRLQRFADSALGQYADRRDRPDCDSTSGLSPHLAWGELSPRQAWHAARLHSAGGGKAGRGAEAWLRQLLWREFSYYLLHHWPDFPQRPFRQHFAAFRWRDDDEALVRWQNGLTGFPLVDAGMRELWATGWMHNRVRMVAASFLVKDLLIPWQRGAAWFWDTLVDADIANNSASWQWVAGCGADAAPYFRIFNPVSQGRKFDPAGTYVRRYVPELAALPDKYLHAPWTAPAGVLESANIVLGRDYPAPIVDHGEARARALARFAALRRG